MSPRTFLRLLRQRKLLRYWRAARLTRRYVDEWTRFPAIELRPGGRLKVAKHPTAKLRIDGVLVVNPWTNAEAPALVELLEGSEMTVIGRWSMKDDARVKLFPGARLTVRGIADDRQASAMLGSRSQILVSRQVDVGANCAISWDVVVSDSNWHALDGKVHVEPTVVGDHCWLAARSMVLPGARLARDSVVAAGSIVRAGTYPERALLAGAPAKVVRVLDEPWKL